MRGQSMQYILAGFSGSESSIQAVLYARDMAKKIGARLHVLIVSTFPAPSSDVYMNDIVDQHVSHCEQLIESLKLRMGASETTRLIVRVGSPAHEIVNHATDYGIGQIVVGCRRQWFKRWPVSHIVRQIMACAPCAVTVIMNQATF
jgi:nucleotide-binding universal stress UspA family protein